MLVSAREEHLSRLYGSGDPASLWVALARSEPVAGEALDEPSGGYARQEIPNDLDHWEIDEAMATTLQEVVFPEATSSWGIIRYCALMDSQSGGGIVAHGSIETRIVSTGRVLVIPDGGITIYAR